MVFIMGTNSVVYEVRAEAEERVDDLTTAIETDCVLYGKLAETVEQLTIDTTDYDRPVFPKPLDRGLFWLRKYPRIVTSLLT